MDAAIKEYRSRREKRLAERGIYPEEIDRIIKYQLRKMARLDARGYRLDDDKEDKENNNNEGSHGNTRLPFGLCMRFGIEIGKDWTPRDAWDALAGKGITAEGAYARLKKGEDPGTPDDKATGETDTGAKEEPVTSIKTKRNSGETKEFTHLEGERRGHGDWVLKGTDKDGGQEQWSFTSKEEMLRFLKEKGVEEFGDPETGELLNPKEMEIIAKPKNTLGGMEYYPGAVYKDLKGWKARYVSRGSAPWRLRGTLVEGTGGTGYYTPSTYGKSFMTKTDMMAFLKDKGVEVFTDPETGETVNPKEMDIPKTVARVGGIGYTALFLGMRDGRYVLSGTDYDGKKRKLEDFYSYGGVKGFLANEDISIDDVKFSPAVKKTEAERTAWTKSKKKEYVEEDGKRYGDLKLTKPSSYWSLEGSTEDGYTTEKKFPTKAEAMKYLKEQGVESVKVGFEEEKENPVEYHVPEAKFKIGGRDCSEAGIYADETGTVYFYGEDLDGVRRAYSYIRSGEQPEAFKERVAKEFGIQKEQLTVSESSKKALDDIQKELDEIEERRKEFEAKATDIPGKGKFMDVHIEERPGYFDVEYAICGYGSDGRQRTISRSGDMYDMEQLAERYGLSMKSLIRDESVQREYDKHRKKMEEFETKAVDIGGRKYADVTVEYDGRRFLVKGTDARGREAEIANERTYSGLESQLGKNGLSPERFNMSDAAKKARERALKARDAIASGDGWYTLGDKDEAYKDIKIVKKNDDVWEIRATDVDGDEKRVTSFDNWDDAISEMSKYGVANYEIKDGDKTLKKPTWSMHNVSLVRKPGGGFLVYADTDRYGAHQIMYETPHEEEAREWLKKNNVPEVGIKTLGMNPNDDVIRTHDAKSLENFDRHRMERAEKHGMLKELDEQTKKETAEMLTDMFDKGAYRMRRKDHFAEIVEGRFKGLLETGTSGGSTSKDGRRITGEKTFGIPKGMSAQEGEKYGFWGLEDDAEAYKDSTARWYGGIIFKFKKDRVGDRVTYSFGDSLDSGRPIAGYAGTKPTIEGISGLDSTGYGGGKRKLKELLSQYRRYKRGDISFGDFRDRVNEECRDDYVECHYHGNLDINDVQSVTFPKSLFDTTFRHMNETTRKNVMTKLKNSGIILQYYDDDTRRLEDGWKRLEEKYGRV